MQIENISCTFEKLVSFYIFSAKWWEN